MAQSGMEKEKGKEKIEGILEGNTSEMQKKKDYAEYVKQITPKNNLFVQMGKAFLVGGLICILGQWIQNTGTNNFGLDEEMAGRWCSMLLVLASAILTGFNLYAPIVKWGGAGALVPITGFANSVASAAVEYQKEGQVYGIGCKIFTIAGPVILYGIFSSWVLGLLYWIGTLL